MRTWKSRPKHVAKITCNKVFQNSNYSICPLNKVPEINCSWGYCSGQQVVRKLKRKNKEWKWCYLECGWIGFSALMISDVSFSVCGLQRRDRRLWRSETWERSCISPYPPPSPQKHTQPRCAINGPSRYTYFFLFFDQVCCSMKQ